MAGSVSVVASQAGDANWHAAPDVTNGFRTISGQLLTDYDGDGRSDLCVYDDVGANWYIRSSAGPVLAWKLQWGYGAVQPVGGDYNGDGVADPAVYDEASGGWYIRSLTGELPTITQASFLALSALGALFLLAASRQPRTMA